MKHRQNMGLIGLGEMGLNLARNLARRRIGVEAMDIDPGRRMAARRIPDREESSHMAIHANMAEMVLALAPPRKLLLLVPAGQPVNRVLEQLAPLLGSGDVVIDGGNSHFRDGQRRARELASKGVGFIDLGISGGPEGALRGPALMIGGERAAAGELLPLLDRVVRWHGDGQGCAWMGGTGAGHFAKMVHNGVEYALMQHLAEAWLLLRRGCGLSVARIAGIFDTWRGGPLRAHLLDITAAVLRARDERGGPLIAAMADRAAQNGTGLWAGVTALELGVPAPSLIAAVAVRQFSVLGTGRQRAFQALGPPPPPPGPIAEAAILPDLQQALYLANWAAYAQGFHLAGGGGWQFGWALSPVALARVWRRGCIIRAGILEEIEPLLAAGPAAHGAPENPLWQPAAGEIIRPRLPALRRVATAMVHAGIPHPGLAAALSYLDLWRYPECGAGLIQLQRHRFGRHPTAA